jgi:hypothetical protein
MGNYKKRRKIDRNGEIEPKVHSAKGREKKEENDLPFFALCAFAVNLFNVYKVLGGHGWPQGEKY